MSDDRRDPIEVDDEITTDVDPAWIASIRAGTTEVADAASDHQADDPQPAHPQTAGTASAGAGDETDDWTSIEPPWDPEATVGASSGLIERIRQEMAAPPATPATPSAPIVPHRVRADRVSTDRVSTDRPSTDRVAAGGRDAERRVRPGAGADVSTTVRWEPRQRLSTPAPVAESVVIAPPARAGIDHTKLAIAIVAAVTLIVIAWLVVGSRGGTESPPVDSVPTSGVESSVPVSEPVRMSVAR